MKRQDTELCVCFDVYARNLLDLEKFDVEVIEPHSTIDWYGLLTERIELQVTIRREMLTKENACFMLNEAYQPETSHFHDDSLESGLL